MNYNLMNKRVILIGLVIIWCAVIFMFSADNSDESSEKSQSIVNTICEMLIPEYDDFTGAERAKVVDKLEFWVRKTAHFTEYAVLGALCAAALYGFKNKFRYPISVGFSFLYACSDEIHQLFVSGRTGQFRDVIIDTSGAVAGALIVFLICLAIKKSAAKNSTV
ncbi:MAG: VanZ family protein [Oscillospiraceae bacterium]